MFTLGPHRDRSISHNVGARKIEESESSSICSQLVYGYLFFKILYVLVFDQPDSRTQIH